MFCVFWTNNASLQHADDNFPIFIADTLNAQLNHRSERYGDKSHCSRAGGLAIFLQVYPKREKKGANVCESST